MGVPGTILAGCWSDYKKSVESSDLKVVKTKNLFRIPRFVRDEKPLLRFDDPASVDVCFDFCRGGDQ